MDKLEFKATFTAIDDAGTIAGIAWPFGTPDSVGDVITKGAFNTPERVPILFAHDQAQVIGIWDSIIETDAGLEVKGRLLLDDVARAREVHALIKEGAVTGLSIGFISRKATARKDGGRTITALDLLEISAVAVPCHSGARITHAKAESLAHFKRTNMDETIIEPNDTPETFEAKFQARLDKIEARMNRPAPGTIEPANGDHERKAFMSFARRGIERITPEEQKALTVANDASAGYLAPESFAAEIIKLTRELSPIRQYARVTTVTTSEVKIPRRVNGTTATWTAETADRTGSEPSYEQITLTPHELATYTDISNALLEDNGYNLEGELAAEFAESFAIAEVAAFISGTGPGKPTGLLANSQIAKIDTKPFSVNLNTASAWENELSTADATVLTNALLSMYHNIPAVHAKNAVWMMNRNTLGFLRKWKNSNGDFMIASPATADMPLTLFGRPIIEASDMPNIAANAFPILFGDLSGYRIVDRLALNVLRDPYSLATKGQVRFHARRRVGGDVTHPDRFIKMKLVSAPAA